MANITLDFGETKNTTDFFSSHDEIGFMLERIINLANLCFGRINNARNALDTIIFGLGHSCRKDFIEISHLTVHGHEDGASKILRVLFERAVTTAYLIKHPNKVDSFIKFGHINNYKLWAASQNADLTKEEWEELTGMSVDDIKSNYENAKPYFEQTDCKTCGTTKKKVSWDIDLASMVRKVGEPFSTIYFSAYSITNLSIHTNVTSAYIGHHDNEVRISHEKKSAILTLSSAFQLLIAVIKAQNEYFSLDISESDIKKSEDDLCKIISKNFQK